MVDIDGERNIGRWISQVAEGDVLSRIMFREASSIILSKKAKAIARGLENFSDRFYMPWV